MKLNVFRTLWQSTDAQNTAGLEEPSEARYRTIFLAIAAFVIPPLVYFIYFQFISPGLVNSNALDFAQLGRNLGSGKGFVTYILRPIALTHGSNPMRQPDLFHGPLFPVMQALAFGIAGAKGNVALHVSGIFYLLTIPVVYRLGKRVFNPQVGLATSAILVFNAMFLEYANSGLHITLFTFLMTCLMLALFNLADHVKNGAPEQQASLPKGKLIWVGVLTALLYLTDPIFVWIVPVVLFYVAGLGGASRIKYCATFLVPMLILMTPWMLRNFKLTGNPIFGLQGMELLMNTKGHYPGDVAYRMASSDLTPGASLFRSIVHKALLSIGIVIDRFPEVNASWLLAFLLPSFLFRYTNPAANSLRRVMMWCFLAILFGTVIFQMRMYLFVSVIPTMLVFAVAYLLHLMQQAQLGRSGTTVAVTLMLVVAIYPLFSTMALGDKHPGLKEGPVAAGLGTMSKRNEAVLSDQPWVVAWFANRPSIWIPADDHKVVEYRKRFKVRWVFLTTDIRGYSGPWQFVYDKMRQWHYTRLSALAESGGTKETPPMIINSKELPLFEALMGFQTIPQSNKVLPQTIIAMAPQADNRVGMTPDSNKQVAP